MCVCVWQERVFLSVSNYIFTVIFVGEMMIKVTMAVHVFWTSTSHSHFLILCIKRQFSSWVGIRIAFSLILYPILFYYFSNFLCLCACVCVWDKVVAMGLYFGSSVYLQSSWNILDGLLVFVSLVDILVSIASAGGNRILGILRVLRLLRTLRPLR